MENQYCLVKSKHNAHRNFDFGFSSDYNEVPIKVTLVTIG